MKTKNNVQKTVLRTGAVIVSFVLISFTVAAQDFWKTLLTNSSFNQIALAMVVTPKKPEIKLTETKTGEANYFYENEYDANLAVEDWMKSNAYFEPVFLQEAEPYLQVEDWMTNEKLFAVAHETENPLALENWMKNNKAWQN
jgi:hypothetical protein